MRTDPRDAREIPQRLPLLNLHRSRTRLPPPIPSQTSQPMTVDLDDLTLAELRAVARWYGLVESHNPDTLREAIRHATRQTPPERL